MVAVAVAAATLPEAGSCEPAQYPAAQAGSARVVESERCQQVGCELARLRLAQVGRQPAVYMLADPVIRCIRAVIVHAPSSPQPEM